MKRKISFVLVVWMFVLSTISSFAAVSFSDVPSNHWAKDFITKMADKKIISGYFDDYTLKATFKPDKSVSYIEAMQMIYNTLKAANKLKSTTGLATKYAAALNANKIPTWAHEAVAYGVEYGILHQDEVKAFVKNGNPVYAKKVDVAVFIGKSLEMKLEALPVLNFVDAETIKTAALPYVDLLKKNKIVDGDTQNKFNPNSIINRAVMATMCSNTYDLIVKESTVVVSPSTPVLSDLEGTIDYVSSDAKMLIVKDTKGDKKSYTLKTTYVRKDGKYITLNDLKQGDTVKLTFNTSGDVQGIEVKVSSNATTGSDDKTRIIDYIDEDAKLLIVKNKKSKSEVYNLKGVRIKIGGRSKDIDDLNKGDGIKLIFDNKGELDEIQVDDTVTSMEGRVESLKEIDKYDKTYLLMARDRTNLIIKKELKIDKDTEIEYDRDDVDADKLVKGMDIYIKYVGDRAIKIEIDEEDKTYQGILDSRILFKKEPILKLQMNSGDVKEFTVDDDVDIDRDGDDKLDLLEEGDIVTIKVEYGKVTEITAIERTDKRSKVDGVIKQITRGDPSSITIKTDDKETLKYEIKRGITVEIKDKDGKKDKNKELKDLEIGYEVRLRLDNGKVNKIEAEGKASTDRITGEIIRIYGSIISVRLFNVKDREDDKISVFLEDDAKIIGSDGKETRLKNLDEDDEIMMNGRFEDEDMFKASRIVVID
ncbi:S-layer homology domain-containing protein [Marinisporobacter balticus]|uniref:S-layer family protein n=1 Tax=Marinisporobacter balticus TaxID=2018667 RepID=A0A4R2KW73_9FIRM|nr:S-layer homology domain-containing protein [Marinisporobacter balticus]TCO78771.1 S-layer family protein [Marinisporobacter balticus]